ncbi:DUF4262 domain-containing protein [Actinoplanes sp. URMC 104]|uniref:DUF4262 domain-containing protein n=1 Tax=Actinoplanes sp. URMC 104 TaxID=3423409 RepID=UPI003F1CDF13
MPMPELDLERAASAQARRNLYLQQTQDAIDAFGWAIQMQHPMPGSTAPAYGYTVGLTALQLPELLISGLPDALTAQLLNEAARLHVMDPYTAGGIARGCASVELRVVDAPHAPITAARQLYPNATPTCLQLLWPDNQGSYPGDPGWHELALQPLFNQAPNSTSTPTQGETR